MTNISRQKIQGIIRKDFPHNEFEVSEYGYKTGNVKIKVDIGYNSNKDPQDEYLWLSMLASKIQSLGGNVKVDGNYSNPSLIVDNALTEENLSDFDSGAFIKTYCQSKIEEILKWREQEKICQDEKKRQYEQRQNAKMARASELNPVVAYDILEGDEKSGVGFATLNGEYGKCYILFSYEKRTRSWTEDNSETYNMSFSIKNVEKRGEQVNYDGGSSSSSDCETIEHGLLSYVATWHVVVR